MTDLTKLSVAELRESDDKLERALRVMFRAGENWAVTYSTWFVPSEADTELKIRQAILEAQGAIAVSEEDKELLEAIEPFVDGSCYLAEPGGKENIGATALIRGLAKKLKRRITGEGR